MVSAKLIVQNAPVVCCDAEEFGQVDHMEGDDTIKLKKDKSGTHHFIPLGWVTKVDGQVHLDRTGAEAMKEWRTSARVVGAPMSLTGQHEDQKASERASTDGMKTPAVKGSIHVAPQDPAFTGPKERPSGLPTERRTLDATIKGQRPLTK